MEIKDKKRKIFKLLMNPKEDDLIKFIEKNTEL